MALTQWPFKLLGIFLLPKCINNPAKLGLKFIGDHFNQMSTERIDCQLMACRAPSTMFTTMHTSCNASKASLKIVLYLMSFKRKAEPGQRLICSPACVDNTFIGIQLHPEGPLFQTPVLLSTIFRIHAHYLLHLMLIIFITYIELCNTLN